MDKMVHKKQEEEISVWDFIQESETPISTAVTAVQEQTKRPSLEMRVAVPQTGAFLDLKQERSFMLTAMPSFDETTLMLHRSIAEGLHNEMRKKKKDKDLNALIQAQRFAIENKENERDLYRYILIKIENLEADEKNQLKKLITKDSKGDLKKKDEAALKATLEKLQIPEEVYQSYKLLVAQDIAIEQEGEKKFKKDQANDRSIAARINKGEFGVNQKYVKERKDAAQREVEKRKAREEQERLAREERERAEAERLAREEEARKAKEAHDARSATENVGAFQSDLSKALAFWTHQKADNDVSAEDQLLTLVTCSYSYNNSRFLVFARELREDETEEQILEAFKKMNVGK